ncbi:pyruvate kinase-like protein [Podospora didyma]|uniref:Pyruvate kinase-like protein n=1 Tax=Podospora didyma TaxID=330526 RepID=A0AAE0N4W3_9PEZI|nr:pyruvate kinase-like protein [Podospora didyma]
MMDLDALFTSDTLLEVRSGKMQKMRGLEIESGIDKSLCNGPVHISSLGIDGDEHDLTFHGGVDKAIHGYCSSHYPDWRQEFPSAADRFRPGGFGENFVTAQMNEKTLCIGDVVAVGDDEHGVLLQVSLPRQPCFKLNHRFVLKNFAPNTYKTSRTGWYYRVLREGTVKAGDMIRLVERKHPKWTIERVQEYLHRNQNDEAMNEELAGIEELGPESRNAFKRRVAAKERKARATAEIDLPNKKWREYRVTEKTRQTHRIVSLILEAVEPLTEPGDAALDEGAHVKIKLGNGLVRAYSIVDGDRNRFQLGIALDDRSRGGSKWLHEMTEVGHVLHVAAITAAVPIASAASHHIFVAAGIGLTAFLALVEAYKRINYSATLHYAVRSADDIPFKERVDKLGDNYVVLYDKAAGQRLDVANIIANMPWNSQLYFCGPKRLMDEAARETRARGIPDSEVHFEAFQADVSGDPFEVVVANKGGKLLKVGGEETLLEVLQKYFDVDSSCSVGNCGTCKIDCKEGRVEHRGTALSEAEKSTSMLACVSRGVGRITVEM